MADRVAVVVVLRETAASEVVDISSTHSVVPATDTEMPEVALPGLLIIFIHTAMCRDRQTMNTAVKIQKHEKRCRLMQ